MEDPNPKMSEYNRRFDTTGHPHTRIGNEPKFTALSASWFGDHGGDAPRGAIWFITGVGLIQSRWPQQLRACRN